MQDILGVMKIIQGLNGQNPDWQAKVAELAKNNKDQQNQMFMNPMDQTGPMGETSASPTNKNFFDNKTLNNMANGMNLQDAFMTGPKDKFNALKGLLKMFGG